MTSKTEKIVELTLGFLDKACVIPKANKQILLRIQRSTNRLRVKLDFDVQTIE